MFDEIKAIETKQSEYTTYRKLKYQEERKMKDKFDNRLFVTHRYKPVYFYDPESQIFEKGFLRKLLSLNVFLV